ncbi:P60-like protein [Aulographum hederae CBS 113979]|uniref:Ribosome biogenesis protein NOP53 n=1 Tax=Aulographum hederae CBS 113979 TaxID=1176131 RepID=A0A6G1HC15_9PEZI|nr:P60-like protein [Aulographum hederae CBS 113979]
MSSSVLPPQQHKQPSRKGKKAWRKNVDISEVQEGLEELVEQEIQGGVIAEKDADALFTIDSTGSAVIQKEYLKTHKPLKADEILAQRSAVPALPQNTKKRPASRMSDGLVPAKHRRTDYVTRKEVERLKNIAYRSENVASDVVQTEDTASHDPWAEQPKVQDDRFTFLEEKKALRQPKTLKEAPISMLKDGKQRPSVKVPEAGKSYNPDVNEWLELLAREEAKEEIAEAARIEQKTLEEERQQIIAREQAAAEKAEKEAGESEWESEWEGFMSEQDDAAPAKRPQRKTQAERNKIERRKEEERKKKHEKKLKLKQAQIDQIKVIRRAVDRKEKESQEAMAKMDTDSDDNGEEVLKKRQPFSKKPIPEAPLEVLLSEDLTDSLRRLKPEGNLLSDRFRNMLLQGKVESRRKMQHRKPKTKASEKWSYKDWKMPKY